MLWVANYSIDQFQLNWNQGSGVANVMVGLSGQVSLNVDSGTAGSIIAAGANYGLVADASLADGSTFGGLSYSATGPIAMSRIKSPVDRTRYPITPVVAAF